MQRTKNGTTGLIPLLPIGTFYPLSLKSIGGNKLTDEIFEKLRGRFKQKRCPTRLAGTRLDRERHPHLRKECDCDDIIYTGEISVPHTFNWSQVFIAKTGTKCIKFEWDYRRDLTEKNELFELQRKGGLTAKYVREQMKRISHREGEFFTYSGDRKHFNADHIDILGVVVLRAFVRQALMYQDDQIFEVVALASSESTPILHFIGDKHHIVIHGQNPSETAKYELGCYPLTWSEVPRKKGENQ